MDAMTIACDGTEGGGAHGSFASFSTDLIVSIRLSTRRVFYLGL